jgi:tRNA pseudouridine38-40 synthase
MTLAVPVREVLTSDCGKVEMPARAATRLALVIEYDGTRYAGSQYQSALPTIQSEMEDAILALTSEKVRVSLAGRTDAGVHAHGQVVSFTTGSALPEHTFVSGLNHYLPEDISVRSARIVPESFDPRRSASKREYEYRILNSSARSAIWHGRAFLVPGVLDAEAMHRAAQLLLGEHDFASFVTSPEDESKSTVRSMYEAKVTRDGDMVLVRLVASAFLQHQVRNTVGALVRVGQGKMTQQEFQDIINVREFGLAGPTVPACGLYLKKVYYGNESEEGN